MMLAHVAHNCNTDWHFNSGGRSQSKWNDAQPHPSFTKRKQNETDTTQHDAKQGCSGKKRCAACFHERSEHDTTPAYGNMSAPGLGGERFMREFAFVDRKAHGTTPSVEIPEIAWKFLKSPENSKE